MIRGTMSRFWRMTPYITLTTFLSIFWLNPFLGSSTWFSRDFYHGKSCSAWSEIHIEKIYLLYLYRFDVWRHIAVILPSFCRFSVIFWLKLLLDTLTLFSSDIYHVQVAQHGSRYILKRISFLYHVLFLMYAVI